MNSMKGRRVVITGATSGIGREIATALASLGAELVLACRDVERGERTAGDILHSTNAAVLAVMPVDVSTQDSIRQFAREYRDRFSGPDVLINNAGIIRSGRETSVDGIELTFATNVLGYFLLTLELLHGLKADAPARIVNVASSYASEPDFGDLQFEQRAYDGMQAYAQSKACDRLLTWALARRLQESGVTANAMAPGLVMTELYRDLPPEARLALEKMGARTVPEGADTAVWLASSPEVEGVSGRFFEQRKEIPCEFRNEVAEERLWGICQSLVG
ncbi:MAG: SDR family NAD(P)-dependent oxidoreductase [Chloroflexota bacterium]|nr:SDR family NAD(P)-dependent oxidoreductase [Chloroflexota bacterium]